MLPCATSVALNLPSIGQPMNVRHETTIHSAGERAAARAEALGAICRQFDIDALYAFGSRGLEALEWLEGKRAHLVPGGSDVDVGVKLPGLADERDLALRDKVRLTVALEDLLGVDRVDLVTFVEADALMAVAIISGELLYARDLRATDELELYLLRRAADLEPLARERRAMILGRSR